MASEPFNARVFRSFESSSRYSPGGYHPLSIDDTLNSGRYRVLHRLGHGSYSTVWLAEDLHYSTCNSTPLPPARYVALKILAADVPAAKRDSRILRKFEEQPLSTLGLLGGLLSWIPGFGSEKKAVQNTGRDFIIRLYDEFAIEGPNGSHHVLVMEFVGPSLSAIKECDDLNLDRLPVAIGLRGVSQLAKAVWFLHSKGVVHGDLHSGNIAFALPSLNSLTVDQLYEYIGKPQTVPSYLVSDHEIYGIEDEDAPQPPSTPDPHKPPYLVVPPNPANLWPLCIGGVLPDPALPSIRVLDFTEAFHLSAHAIPGTPLGLAAPELLLSQFLPKSEITSTIDIWAFACAAYELLSDDVLFNGLMPMPVAVLADIIHGIGGKEKVPARMWKLFFEEIGGAAFYHEDGAPVIKMMGGYRNWGTWEERITELELGDQVEAVVRKILEAAVVMDPRERATASETMRMIPESWANMGDGEARN